MLLYIEDKSDSSPPFCLRTVMKKQGTCQVFSSGFLFLWQDIVMKICSSLTWSCILYFVVVVVVFTSDNESIKCWILSLLLLTLYAASFALVQLGLIFSLVPSFWSEITWPSLSRRQNYQLGPFCEICELWRFCLHFGRARKFAS